MKAKRILSVILCIAMVLSTMSFTVFAEGEAVAKIGDTEYSTLAEAITEAAVNDEIELLSAVDFDGITIGKTVCLNLGDIEHTNLDKLDAGEGYSHFQKYNEAKKIYVAPTAEAPKADVAELTGESLNIHTHDSWGGLNNQDLTLDVGYIFKAPYEGEGANESQYGPYHADFVVSADKNIPAETIALVGQYSAVGEDWILLSAPYTKDTQIRLLKDGMGLSMNYYELCNTVREFNCGAMDISADKALDGTTLTVELRLFPVEYHVWGTTSWNNESNDESILIGSYSYTFGTKYLVGDTSYGSIEGAVSAAKDADEAVVLPKTTDIKAVIPAAVEDVAVTVTTANATVTFDKNSDVAGATISVVETAEDSDEFEISLSGGAVINSATVTMPTDDEGKIKVYYIDGNGDKVYLNGIYNEENNSVTFTTTHFSVWGTEGVVTTQDEFVAAIAAAGDNDVITLAEGKYTMPNKVLNKNITIKDTEEAIVEMLTSVNATGSTINFDGVTVKFDNDNYEGIQNAKMVTYKDCTHIGTEFLYAPTVLYTGCTFEMYNENTEYAVWTYGAKDVDFINCTFNTHGKAILVYTEGATQAAIKVEGCTFNSTGKYTDKAAVELGESANGNKAEYKVEITNSTADDFDTNGTASTLLGNKNNMDLGVEVPATGNIIVTAKTYDIDDFKADLEASSDGEGNFVFDGKGKTYKWSIGGTVNNGDKNAPNRYNNDNAQYFLLNGAKNVTLKNVNFQFFAPHAVVKGNIVGSGEVVNAAQLYFQNTGDFTVENCSFDKTILTNFHGAGASTVTGCTFTNITDSYAVKDIRGANITVSGNKFENCSGGIMVSAVSADFEVDSVNVEDNEFKNVSTDAKNRGLVQLAKSGAYADDAVSYEDNTATNCGSTFRLLNDSATDNVIEIVENSNGELTMTSDSVERVAKIGTKTYKTLQEAIDASVAGDKIELMADIAVEETKTKGYAFLVGPEKDITLDLNGNTISSTVNANGNYALISVQGKLNVIGGGEIALTNTDNSTAWAFTSSVIGLNNHDGYTVDTALTLDDDVTIKHNGGTCMAYAVDMMTFTGCEVTVKNATLSSTYTGVRIFGNNGNKKLNIEGGNVQGDSRAVWVHHSGSSDVDVLVSGGTIESAEGRGIHVSTAAASSSPVDVNITGGTITAKSPITLALDDTATIKPTVTKAATVDIPLSEDYRWNANNELEAIVVAEIDGVKYSSFDKAWKAAVEAGGTKTIKLLDDATYSVTSYSSNMKDAAITIDLNGFDLTLNADLHVAGNMYGGNTLTINDSTNEGSIIFNEKYAIEFVNDSADTLIINGGKFVAPNGGAIIVDGVVGSVNQTITINGGDFTGVAGDILGGSINENDNVTKASTVDVKAPVGYKWDAAGKLVEYTAIGDLVGVFTTEADNGVVTIWGELKADPIQELYIDVLDADGNKMGSVKLNDVGGIYDATTTNLSWFMTVVGDKTDAYWTTTWNEGYPTADVQPATAKLYVDGVMVNERPVQMNRADGLDPVVWKDLFYCAEVNGVQYKSIQAAIDAAAAGNTITLISDRAETDIKVAADDNVIIDLNGKTVTGDFMVYGKATIKNGEIVNTAFVSGIESNGASADLTVENLDVTSNRHALRVDGGKARIISGTYTSTVDGSSCYAVNVGGDIATELVIDGGEFIPSAKASTQGTALMLKNDKVTATINGGTFHSADIYSFENYGTLTINGGTFEEGFVANDKTTIAGGTFGKDPSAYVVEGKEATKVNGAYTINEKRKFIIKASKPEVVAGEEFTVSLYLDGTDLSGATWELAYNDEYFEKVCNNELKGFKSVGTIITEDTPLVTYTFKAIAQATEVFDYFTLVEGSSQTVDESAVDIKVKTEAVPEKVTIKLIDFTVDFELDDKAIGSDGAGTIAYEMDYDGKEHVFEINPTPSDAEVKILVNGNAENLDYLKTIKACGEYKIEYTITKIGYAKKEGTFTLTINKPAYFVEYQNDYVANGKTIVLVHTDSDVISFNYNGMSMYDVTYKNALYKYSGESYAKVFALVVDTISGGVLADYEALVEFVPEAVAKAYIITQPDPEHDLTGNGAIDISDVTTSFGVYNTTPSYFAKHMAVVLKADVNGDKSVNFEDTGAYTAAFTTEYYKQPTTN